MSVKELYLPPIVEVGSPDADDVARLQTHIGKGGGTLTRRLYILAELPVETPCIELDSTCPDNEGLLGVRDDAQIILHFSVRRDELQYRRAACIVGDTDKEFVVDEDILAVDAINLHADELVTIDHDDAEHLASFEFRIFTWHLGDETEDGRIHIKIFERYGLAIAHLDIQGTRNGGDGNSDNELGIRLHDESVDGAIFGKGNLADEVEVSAFDGEFATCRDG